MLERARDWMKIAGILALSLHGLMHSAYLLENASASAIVGRTASAR